MTKKIKCVVVDDEPMAREILASYIEKVPSLSLAKSFKNASEVISFLETETADVFFLDINMPEISGLSLAKIINKKATVIFTTAYREYAVDGFDLNATDYLLKPISFDRFFQAIEKVTTKKDTDFSEKTSVKQPSNFMFVRADRKMIKVNFNEILYIESLNDYIKIHTKEDVIVTRETISNIETKLPKSDFLRTHRSYIIAFQKLNSYTNEYVEIDKKAIPISRSYKEGVLQKLSSISS